MLLLTPLPTVVAALFLLTLAFGNLAIDLHAIVLRPPSLEEKVKRSKAILQVSLVQAIPTRASPIVNPFLPNTNTLVSPIVCKAKVTQVLKGPTNLAEIEFRSVPFPNYFLGRNLEDAIGRECFVFLEERPVGDPPPQLWLSEPPRLLAYEYTEYRFVDGHMITETYSHSNYVARIRALAQ
jgi:hypothetical protein